MRLLEFQGKRLLSKAGIPIPRGELVRSPDELRSIQYPAILKAQVLSGGRGKSGGIVAVRNINQGLNAGKQLFESMISGKQVRALLCEEIVPVINERFISLVLDSTESELMLIASPKGGIDVEYNLKKDVSLLLRKRIDPYRSVPSHIMRAIARTLELRNHEDVHTLVQGMLSIFRNYDATLIEINPMGCDEGGYFALDAKIVLDSKAYFRHRSFMGELLSEQEQLLGQPDSMSERIAAKAGLLYIPLEGNIGLISDGAGTGMLMLDMIHEEGGKAECFCEMGGQSNARTMRVAMEIVLANPRVSVLLIGLIGGLTRMDEMAEGIVDYLGSTPSQVPIVVRMCGTKEEQGRAILLQSGIASYDDLNSAVRQSVLLARV